MDKQTLRKMIKARREGMDAEEARTASKNIVERILSSPKVCRCSKILSYMPVRNEADIGFFNQWALNSGKELYLPRVKDSFHIIAVRIKDLHKELVPGSFEIPEPMPELPPIDPAALDLIIVPGVAFDRAGNRLGHGKGYYDRFLAGCSEHAFKLGVAYGFQVFDSIPHEAYDIKVDALATEKEWVILNEFMQA